MTSTSVKDVGSAFANLYAGAAQGTGASAGATSFQQIWNSHVSKGDNESVENAQPAVKDTNADFEVSETDEQVEKPERQVEEVENATEAEKEHPIETDSESAVKADVTESENPELSQEELKAAMEVLSAATVELMQKIADTFGISVEELQVAMEELGMTATDVLDGAKLGELMLHLGGASDSYALVTDETLYDNYRMLMQEQKTTLEAVAKEVGVEPEQLEEMIARELQGDVSVEELPDELLQQSADSDSDGMVNVIEVSEEAPAISSVEDAGKSATEGQPDGRQTDEKGMNGEASDAKQSAELVNHNVTTDSFKPEIQQTESIYTSASWDADTQNIMRQIMDYMKIQVNAETTSLEMQLHPASLGTIRVNIASNGGVVTANFVAQNEAVKAALESQIIQLRETFAEQGVKVEAIEVTVQTHQFEQNLEQGRGRNNQENSTRRNRTRRINLNDPVYMETMEEEDVLAAELLTAGGSTVDYTV